MNGIEDDARKRGENCLDNEILFLYREGRLGKRQAAKVEEHLIKCRACRAEVATLYRIDSSPLSVEQEKDIQDIVAIVESRPVTAERSERDVKKKPDVKAAVKERIRDFFHGGPALKPVIAFAAFVVLMLGSWRGVHFYNTGWQLAQADKIIHQHINLDYMHARFSRTENVSPVGEQMSQRDRHRESISDARQRIEDVLNREKSLRGQWLLFEALVLQRELEKADSLASLLETQHSSAALHNDIGVLYMKLEKYEQALDYFNRAIDADSTFAVGYYNKALLYYNLEKDQLALDLLDKYIQFETDTKLKSAALRTREHILRSAQFN